MNHGRVSTILFTSVALGCALAIACVLSLFASSLPDALEYVAGDAGFADTARPHPLDGGPLAGYAAAGVPDPQLAASLAGAAGCALTFAGAVGIGMLGRRRSDRS